MSVHVQEVRAVDGFGSPESDAQRSLSASVDMVRSVLPDFDQVGLTVIDDGGGVSTCAQAGDMVTDLDRLQYDLGEGPCFDSIRDVVAVVAPRLELDERWGRYGSSAAALGVRSQVAVPLRWGEGTVLGVLNMYSTTRADVEPTAPPVAGGFAAQLAGALVSFREIENLHRALDTRKTIGVAMGLLMAQYELTESAAFAVLRRRSSYANVKLRDVASQIAAGGDEVGMELPPAATC